MKVAVNILLPNHWWQRPLYELTETIECAGYVVPAGFISDGATVPRILWPVFPPIGRYLKATLVHDHALQLGIDRKQCDLFFKDCLIELKVKPWRATTMFIAVRIFGIVKTQFKR